MSSVYCVRGGVPDSLDALEMKSTCLEMEDFLRDLEICREITKGRRLIVEVCICLDKGNDLITRGMRLWILLVSVAHSF